MKDNQLTLFVKGVENHHLQFEGEQFGFMCPLDPGLSLTSTLFLTQNVAIQAFAITICLNHLVLILIC